MIMSGTWSIYQLYHQIDKSNATTYYKFQCNKEITHDMKPGKYLKGWVKNNVIQWFGCKSSKTHAFLEK